MVLPFEEGSPLTRGAWEQVEGTTDEPLLDDLLWAQTEQVDTKATVSREGHQEC